MKQFNILFITPVLNIWGQESLTLLLAAELKRRGHKVYWLSSGGPLLNEVEKSGIKHILGPIHKRDILGVIRASLYVRRALLKNSIDIIHAQEVFPTIMGFLSLLLSRSSRVCLLWHNHGIKARSYPIIGRLFNVCAHYVIANSNSEREKLIRNGLLPRKVRTIHNGIEPEKYDKLVDVSYLREKFHLSAGSLVAGVIGRFVEVKGHRYFIEAIPGIIAAVPNARFLMVGGGELETEYRKLVKKLSIEDYVIFAGSRRDIPQILSLTDVLVLPSLVEPFGMVILEAMASGKPVVATSVGGIPESVVNGRTGLLVPPQDSNALRDAILKLFKNKDLARTMGAKAKKRLREHFTIEKMGERIEEAYYYLVSNRNK